MRDYKTTDYKFPRSQREAGWYDRREWDQKQDGSGWLALVGWGAVSAVLLWVFLVLVLA